MAEEDDLEKEMAAAMAEEQASATDGGAAAAKGPSIVSKILAAKFTIISIVVGIAIGYVVATFFGAAPEVKTVQVVGSSAQSNTESKSYNPDDRLVAPPVAEDVFPDETEKKEENAEPSFFHKMPPLVVNVFEKNSIHYLKLQIVLELVNESVVAELDKIKPKLKDRLLFLVSDRTLREILTPAGKGMLKEDILIEFTKNLGKNKVKKVYFTEFTVQ